MEFLSAESESVKPGASFEEAPMDVTETEVEVCCEDGEINSDEEKDVNNRYPNDKPENQPTGFSSKSVSNEGETLRKQNRDERFLIPVRNFTEVHQDQLLSLYRDLGIYKKNERHYRFNSIHMRGTENMSTEDVLEYFGPFSPSYVEWINDVSCNVVWQDDIATARAFLNLSRRIKNLDKIHSNADPFEKDFRNDDSVGEVSDGDDSVDARNIRTAIPPGHWRLGVPCEKGRYVLLRYATRSDKKHQNSEKNSEYYRKHGNPHYGNIPGLISNSRRAELKKQRQTERISERQSQGSGKKNPWEDLAYEWRENEESNSFDSTRSKNLLNDEVNSDFLDLRISLSSRKAWAKRSRADFEGNPNSSEKESSETKGKVPRMKMYADDEEKKSDKNVSSVSSSRFKPESMKDLRNKINLKKRESKMIWGYRKTHTASSSELSASENEYDDGDSGEWALEQYHDLRESLRHHKKSNQQRHKFVTYESDSEGDLSDSFEERDLSCRPPLQIEIENNECYPNMEL